MLKKNTTFARDFVKARIVPKNNWYVLDFRISF